MKTEILIMIPNQPVERREVEVAATYFRLAELLEPIVGGGIEHVTVLADFNGGEDFKRADMFVNEVGMLLDCIRNEEATAIYRRNALMHHGVTDPESLPYIAGPAVLFRDIVWR